MKILFIISTYPNYGGTEKVTTFLANTFAKAKNEVHIASFEQPHPELLEELHPKVQFHSLAMPYQTHHNIKYLKRLVREQKISFIINQHCLPYYMTRLCNRIRKGTDCKLISVLHGIPNKSKKTIIAEDELAQARTTLGKLYHRMKLRLYHNIIQWSIRYTYNHSDQYILLSELFKDVFCEYARIYDTSKLMAIPNSICIRTDYETNYLPGKKKQLLYVGRMDMENKRVNRIVEAWEEIYREFPDWELILVGDGPHKPILEDYVKEKKIERVIFQVFSREEPTKYYQDASILLLTSDMEGFGMVITEGMSYGVVPIVYGSYPAIYDIINNKVSGFITHKPYSQKETVKYMKLLMNNPELRTKMAKEAIKDSKKFTMEDNVNLWSILFIKLQNEE